MKIFSKVLTVLTVLFLVMTYTAIGEIVRQSADMAKTNNFADFKSVELDNLGFFIQGPHGNLKPIFTGSWIRLGWPVVLAYPAGMYAWYYLCQGGVLDLFGIWGSAAIFIGVIACFAMTRAKKARRRQAIDEEIAS